MKKRLLFFNPIVLLILGSSFYSYRFNAHASSLSGEKTFVLYDASSGATPSNALMAFTDFPPGAASITFFDNATVLDTTASGSDTFAGWTSSQATTAGFPVLDRTMGIQVNFTLQVESESHSKDNRSGFSVILLDQEAKGIELSFWRNEIWAQNDGSTGGLFTIGEGTMFSTGAGLTDYQLTIDGGMYTLTANALPLLSGPVRDYSSFEGFPDPYETPNFLFLGDDTTSGQSRTRLSFVSVTGSEPVFPALAMTSTNTSSPLPTATLTPLPTVTLAPSPTPTGRVPGLCSSGWLLLAVPVSSILVKRRRHAHKISSRSL